MPRKWEPVGWASFQVRTPISLKQRLVRLAQTTGRSQQSIIIEALEHYLGVLEQEAELGECSPQQRGAKDG